MNFHQSDSQCPTVQLAVEAPSSPEIPFLLLLTASEVRSQLQLMMRYSFIKSDFAAANITVWSRDHDWRRKDGEVSHAVCSKTEHPEYSIQTKHDKDIALLTLCKPLMFTESK